MKKILILIMSLMISGNLDLSAKTDDQESCVEIPCQMKDGHKGPKTHAPAKRLKLFKSDQNIYICSTGIGVDAIQVQLLNEQGEVISSDYIDITEEEYTPCCYIGNLEFGSYIIKIGIGCLTFEGQFDI